MAELASHLTAARGRVRLWRRARNLAAPCDAGRLDQQTKDLDELARNLIEVYRRTRDENEQLKERVRELEAENERLRDGS